MAKLSWPMVPCSRGSADALATSLYTAAQAHLPGHRLRTDYTDGDPDL